MHQNNTPQLRFKEFYNKWEENHIDQIFKLSNNQKLNNNSHDTIKHIELDNLSQGTGLLLDFKVINKAQRSFKKGQVLFGRLRPYLKKFWHASFEGSCGGEIWVMDGLKVKNRFLFYMVQTNYFNYLINVSSGTKMPRADWGYVKDKSFYIPGLDEQQKIASFLSSVDSKIEKLIRKKELLEEYKKGVMQKLFTQEIRFKNDDGNDYPEWEENRLSDLTWYQEGPGVRKNQYRRDGVKLLNVGNLEKNKLNLSKTYRYISNEEAYGHYKHFLIDKDDILIACSGVSFNTFSEKICKAGESHLPLCMNTSTMRFKVNIELDRDYLFQFLKSFNFKKQVFKTLTGSAQFNFGPSHIKSFRLMLPIIKEQKKIASFLTYFDSKIESVSSQIDKTKEFKKGLLQQMFV